jgi:hypothetical protein
MALLLALLTLAFAGEQKQHAGPRPPEAMLELASLSMNPTSGLVLVEGKVKNVSRQPLELVWVEALLLDKAGQVVTRSDSTLVHFRALQPGELSPFRVYAVWNASIVSCRVEFSQLSRRGLPAAGATVSVR